MPEETRPWRLPLHICDGPAYRTSFNALLWQMRTTLVQALHPAVDISVRKERSAFHIDLRMGQHTRAIVR